MNNTTNDMEELSALSASEELLADIADLGNTIDDNIAGVGRQGDDEYQDDENNSDDNDTGIANVAEDTDITGNANTDDAEGTDAGQGDDVTEGGSEPSNREYTQEGQENGSEESTDGNGTSADNEDAVGTKQPIDGKVADTTGIDYKKFYETLAGAEFVVNGKKVKGITDPAKLIEAQQMAGGYSKKMKGIKEYRPLMHALKENGMVNDPDKFNLMMDIANGDVEAIKTHMKSLNIDPYDLSLDEISYDNKNYVESDVDMFVRDSMDMADNAGVKDRFGKIVGEDWDDSSFDEFIKDPAVREDLISHLSDGTYDVVQQKIAEIDAQDYSGKFSELSSIDQYRTAYGELAKESEQEMKTAAEQAVSEHNNKVEEAKARILASRQEKEYALKAEQEQKKVEQRRQDASNMNRRTTKTETKSDSAYDPFSLKGEALDELIDYFAAM